MRREGCPTVRRCNPGFRPAHPVACDAPSPTCPAYRPVGGADSSYKLPGPTKPASGKDGPTVRREVLMDQHCIYVGIDVAKAG